MRPIFVPLTFTTVRMLQSIRTPNRNILAIPAVPGVVFQLRDLLKNSDLKGNTEIVNLLEQDLSLSAQVIKLANSVVYRAGRPTTSLPESLRRVGLSNLERLVTVAMLDRSLTEAQSAVAGKLLRQAKEYANICAVLAARFVNTKLPVDATSAYVLGLFAESGYILQAISDGKVDGEQPHLNHLEPDAWDNPSYHCHVSYVLARHWGLPKSWALAMRHHHAPLAEVEQNLDEDTAHLVGLLQIAKLVAFGPQLSNE